MTEDIRKTIKILLVFALILIIIGIIKDRREKLLYLGIDANIADINYEKETLKLDGEYINNKTKNVKFTTEDEFKCENSYILYVDYETGNVQNISFSTLEKGDHVILNIYDKQLINLEKKHIAEIYQIQLATQRLNDVEDETKILIEENDDIILYDENGKIIQ